jgi:peptidoglycan/xylan/chitin deacetylase (PgdA/CDA1 family)
MYHSVPDRHEAQWMDPCNCLSPDRFERQMRYLAQHRQVVSIDQLTQQLTCGKPISRGTVAITFDDGYRNNLTVAAPILAKYNLPATIYLATDYVETGKNQWIDVLYTAFRARRQHRLSLAGLGDWDLTDKLQREDAYEEIAGHLIKTDVQARQSVLSAIDTQLSPSAYPPRLTLNWDEVRQLQQRHPHITLGIHTANHLDLSAHPDQVTPELEMAIRQVVEATGDRPKHLAFPYNRYSPCAREKVKAAQLASATAVFNDPVVRADTSSYALPRLEAPQSLLLLKSWTNGGFPDISQRLFKRTWIHPY